jgi:hypothetical protein
MSLCNYVPVPAKECLAQLMTDHVTAGYAYPGSVVADPHAAIADLAQAGPRQCPALESHE